VTQPVSESEAQTLTGLVGCYSPSHQEEKAATWLVQHMQKLGYTQSFIDEAGNAVGVKGSGERQIILLGHIDTVHGEIPVRMQDGILYGRGSVDAKGALASFVDAAAQVGAQNGWQIVVIGAVGEETDSRGARYLAPRYHPEYAIIGEPSGWQRVTLGYKGSAWAEVTVQRAQSHTASGKESACEAAVAQWQKLTTWVAAFNQDRERAFEQILLSLRGMNSKEDGFSQSACLMIGARLPVDVTPEDWYARLALICEGASINPQGFPVPAFQGSKNTPLVRAFLAGIRSQGGTAGFLLKSGTADANIVAPVWNCPVVVYGPGDSALDHTPDEHILLSEYLAAVEVLKKVIITLTNQN
jgi:LysW-gamma-L-lysine carboxypeptidase